MRRSILACGLLLAFAGMATAAAAATGSQEQKQLAPTTAPAPRRHDGSSDGPRARTADGPPPASHPALPRRHAAWLTVMAGRPPGNIPRSLAPHRSPARLRRLVHRWRHRAHRTGGARRIPRFPGLALYPPLRGQLGRLGSPVLGRSSRWTSRSRRGTAAGSSVTKARPITGVPSSRSGSRCARHARVAFRRGRPRREIAACIELLPPTLHLTAR